LLGTQNMKHWQSSLFSASSPSEWISALYSKQ
jgi:hypothetical protein